MSAPEPTLEAVLLSAAGRIHLSMDAADAAVLAAAAEAYFRAQVEQRMPPSENEEDTEFLTRVPKNTRIADYYAGWNAALAEVRRALLPGEPR